MEHPQKFGAMRRRLATLVSLSVLLSACGGGGSGGSGGQEPDPVVVDIPIAYVKRPLPRDVEDDDNDGDELEILADDILDPDAFNPGAVLFIRARASGSAPETNISDRAYDIDPLFQIGDTADDGNDDGILDPDERLPYDVKDIEVSPNGEKLVFAMRAPENEDLDDDEQPKWDLWEYEITTDTLRRVFTDATAAQEGNDVAPHYLPDGRIVFSSDRQHRSKAILLDDGKTRYTAMHEDRQNGEYAFLLHVVEDNGADLKQITFNQSHDLQPTVLANGRIMFLRWDHYNNNSLSLYTVKPDGSDMQFYYGFHSQNTGTNAVTGVFSQPREMPDGRILVTLRQRTANRLGGDIVFVDGRNFTEINVPTFANQGNTNPGQVSASLLTVNIDDTPSPHGHFNSAYPFYDGSDRSLVSWSQCRLSDPDFIDDPDDPNFDPDAVEILLPCTTANLQDPDAEEADPLYGVWIYNPIQGTQLPVVAPEQDTMFTDVVAMEPRTPPVFFPDPEPGVDFDQSYADDAVGVVNIKSVYDIDGVDTTPNGIAAIRNPATTDYANRPARFIRIIKAVSEPDDDTLDFDNDAFGVAGGQRMKEILGYVPIEPDGSAMFKVPSDVAFAISIVDANLRRGNRPRHEMWLQVAVGETLQCNGCHTGTSTAPHGRRDAEPPSINTGAATTGVPFPNTNPAMFAEQGETMAETYARTNGNGPRTPNFNILYTDEWTDRTNAGLTPDPDITIRFTNSGDPNALPTTPPVGAGCQNNWNSTCRETINYLQHIQPIWDYVGRENNAAARAVCTDCHSKTGMDAMMQPIDQVPAGQLELTNEAPGALNFNPNQQMLWVMSYLDIFVQDYYLELDAMGALQRRTNQVQTGVDEMGNPIIEDQPIVVQPVGQNFLNVFAPGGTHDGGLTRLSPAERKLITEWLNIGAQYYNNPFDAPLN